MYKRQLLPPPSDKPISLDINANEDLPEFVTSQRIEFLVMLRRVNAPDDDWGFPTGEVLQEMYDKVRQENDHAQIFEVALWHRVDKNGIASIMLSSVNLQLMNAIRHSIRLYRGQDFFMEPISQLLVTEGILVDCNNKFINKYKTMSGHWIMAIPHIREAQAYILYTLAHKILGYLYKVIVLGEAHRWTREVLFCCCSDFLQMRKYRAVYLSAKSNARGYDAGSLSRRPPSKGSDALKDQGCSGNPKVS